MNRNSTSTWRWLAWRAQRLGSSVIAITMAGALLFGGMNHFVFARGRKRVS